MPCRCGVPACVNLVPMVSALQSPPDVVITLQYFSHHRLLFHPRLVLRGSALPSFAVAVTNHLRS